MQDALRQFKAEFFQVLAHPTRIAIIERLRNSELSAGALIERLGVEQANVSQHLGVLRARTFSSTVTRGIRFSTRCATRSSLKFSTSCGATFMLI